MNEYGYPEGKELNPFKNFRKRAVFDLAVDELGAEDAHSLMFSTHREFQITYPDYRSSPIPRRGGYLSYNKHKEDIKLVMFTAGFEVDGVVYWVTILVGYGPKSKTLALHCDEIGE